MYIVTSRPISEIFNHPDEVGYFAFKSDAEIYAQKQAAETNETQTVLLLTEESQFLPPEQGPMTMDKVWVVISDGHLMDYPAVNVVTTEKHAMDLVHEMWNIWLSDYGLPSDTLFPEPNPCLQGNVYTFEDSARYWENVEWHHVYEVEVTPDEKRD